MKKQGKNKQVSVGEKAQVFSQKGFELINPNAAGIDIGASEHWVSVPIGRDSESVRRFGCFTSDLQAMVTWLKQCGIKTVAMESTSVYWIPMFQILETSGFEVRLVNAHFVKTVPGRKSDVLDCQWLQQLHTYGLLSGSFRPEDQICVLRSYIRQRDNLIRSSSTHILRMQKALQEMNLHLNQVLSDITGITGLKIIRAIVGGERDPKVLASMKDCRVKSSITEIEKALTGDYRTEHIFVLKQELHLYEIYIAQIQLCDIEIEQYLGSFEDKNGDKPPLPPEKTKKTKGNSPQFDLRSHLYRISGVDFTAIDGFGVLTVQTLLSEVGLDPGRFPTVKHFTSWLGLCPGSRISGGKVLSSKTRKVVNRAATALRVAAQSLASSKSAAGAFYRRKKAQLGAPKAITATAHKLARIFYHMWKHGDTYVDTGANSYEHKYKQRAISNLKKKAKDLGFDLVEQPQIVEVS
ncbi:IS110 family transposase [Calothrix sp. PCC 6303]|nr:IS110 family transposase [Calothrix sp. PCC 6303]